jgi:hypothetical protein
VHYTAHVTIQKRKKTGAQLARNRLKIKGGQCKLKPSFCGTPTSTSDEISQQQQSDDDVRLS